MIPSFRNRVIMLVAVAVGANVWVMAAPGLQCGGGLDGISLFSSKSGFIGALMQLFIFGFPAIVLSLWASTSGNPIAGLFTGSVGLCVLATVGGSIDGWYSRPGASLPGDYWGLLLEVLLWFGAWLGAIMLILIARGRLSKKFGWLANQPHVGQVLGCRLPDRAGWVATGVTVLTGGVLSYVLLQSSEAAQVNGALIIAFTLAAFVGMLVAGYAFQMPEVNPIGVLLCPVVVAVLGYLVVLLGGGHELVFVEAVHRGNVFNLALPMPIHYASAAMVGTCAGTGWAQVWLMNESERAR